MLRRRSDSFITGDIKMLNFKTLGLAVSAAVLSMGLATAPAFAQDSMKKDTMSKDSMSKDSMKKDSMSKDSKDTMSKDAPK